MADDEVSKQAGKAVQATVTGAASLVSGPGGVALAVGAAVTFNVFEALAGRNDEALREFRVAALEDEVIKLRDGLRALEERLGEEGKTPDRQDPLTQHAVASAFVQGVVDARTPEKKEALVHATVAQFDPRRGPPAFRDYWLKRVRDLPEYELAMVMLIAERGPLMPLNGEMLTVQGQQLLPVELSADSVHAFTTIVQRMIHRAEVGALITTSADSLTLPWKGTNYMMRPYKLTRDGEILVSFCKGD